MQPLSDRVRFTPQASSEIKKYLARTSHQISTANTDFASSSSSDLVGPTQATVKYDSYDLGRLPRIQGELGALVTKPGEKYGLAPEERKGLRIFIENGQYVLGLCNSEKEDTIFDCDGFELYVNPQSMKYVVGLTVDYIPDENGGAFELSNSFSADGQCHEGKGGCGCKK